MPLEVFASLALKIPVETTEGILGPDTDDIVRGAHRRNAPRKANAPKAKRKRKR